MRRCRDARRCGSTVAGFLILPPIVCSVAVKQISRQLDREVSIEKIKINPFTLSTTIRGLLVKDKDGEPFVSWNEVYVNFQLSSFFGHAWVFKEISTSNPFVRVQMNQDYTFNFSDILAKFATNAPVAAPPKAPGNGSPLISVEGFLATDERPLHFNFCGLQSDFYALCVNVYGL